MYLLLIYYVVRFGVSIIIACMFLSAQFSFSWRRGAVFWTKLLNFFNYTGRRSTNRAFQFLLPTDGLLFFKVQLTFNSVRVKVDSEKLIIFVLFFGSKAKYNIVFVKYQQNQLLKQNDLFFSSQPWRCSMKILHKHINN